MFGKVRTYIERNRLLEDFQPVAVAVSGGADSVALLHVLHRLGYEVTALHCNFHLRGEESDRDEQFVRQLCQELHIPLRVKHFDTQAYAQEHHLSVEMAARDLRYQWFAEETSPADGNQGGLVAVAHHRDDQAETILMNLVRGTGLRGLRGMMPLNKLKVESLELKVVESLELKVIRPLLCVTRQEILAYLDQEGLNHVEDSTNQDTHIRRNLIRHQLIPLLQQLNPSIIQTLAEEQQQFSDYYLLAQERLEELTGKTSKTSETSTTSETSETSTTSFDLQAVAGHPASETILYHILQPYGFQPDVIRQLNSALHTTGSTQTGKRFHSPTHTAELHRGELLIYPRTNPNAGTVSQDSAIPERLHIERISRSEYDLDHSSYATDSPTTALFDADKLSASLTLRHWQQGDTFAPFGMHGRRQKVSDYFTDHHFSRKQKEETWLLLCGDEIAWIIGHRTSELFRIDANTRTLAKISL